MCIRPKHVDQPLQSSLLCVSDAMCFIYLFILDLLGICDAFSLNLALLFVPGKDYNYTLVKVINV